MTLVPAGKVGDAPGGRCILPSITKDGAMFIIGGEIQTTGRPSVLQRRRTSRDGKTGAS